MISGRLSRFMICLFLIVAIVGIYWQTNTHGAVNCDDYYITELECFQTTIFSYDNFLFGLQYAVCGVWMPLTYFVVGVEAVLFGTNYGGWHLFAAGLHTLNALLLFFTLQRMTGSTGKSGLVAGIFALHPLNVEAVAWLATIRVLIAAFFALWSLYFYTGYVKTMNFGKYALSGLCYLCSLFSFPLFVTLPFVFLLTDVWPFARDKPGPDREAVNDDSGQPLSSHQTLSGTALKLVWEKLFFFLVMIVAGLTVINTHDLPQVHHYPLTSRLMNAVLAYGSYLKKLFYPVDLAAFYPYPTEFPLAQVVGMLLFLLAVSGLLFRHLSQRGYLLVGWLWFLGMIFPFIGLVQVGTQAMADHYTYLAMVGFWIAVIWGGADNLLRFRINKKIWWLAGLVILLVLGRASWKQAGYWKDSSTLATRMLQVTDNNYEAYNYLGQAQVVKGHLEQAANSFAKGLAIRPDHLNLNFNMALLLTRQEQFSEALPFYKKILTVDPGYLKAWNNLGTLSEKLGDNSSAEYYYRQALAVNPDYLLAWRNLAGLYRKTGRLEQAVRLYQKILPKSPDKPDIHYQLGLTLYQQRRSEQAAYHLRQALKLNPENIFFQQAWQEIAATIDKNG